MAKPLCFLLFHSHINAHTLTNIYGEKEKERERERERERNTNVPRVMVTVVRNEDGDPSLNYVHDCFLHFT